MTETFEIKGIWYLPGQDVYKEGIPGTLKYSPDMITLDLIGTFLENGIIMQINMKETSYKKVIYGFSDNGKMVTLYGCIASHSQKNSPGFDTISYTIHHFYIGTQLIEDESQKIIKSCEFSLTNLNVWLNLNIMDFTEENNRSKLNISIDPNKSISQTQKMKINCKHLFISENISWQIHFSKNYHSKEITEIILNKFYTLSSTDDQLLSYDYCIFNLGIVKRLLTVLIGSPIHFSYIDIILPTREEIGSRGEKCERKNWCRVFFTQIGDINKHMKISPNYPTSMLILREDIKDNMETIFENWFSLWDTLSEIVNPYIGDLYLPAYQESIFKQTVQGLASYHRFFINELKSTDKTKNTADVALEKERGKILSFINDNISKEYTKYFLDRVNYEEDNLRVQLKEIFDILPDKLKLKLYGKLNSKEKNKILQAIVDTRNYFTHRGHKDKYPLAIINDNKKLNLLTKKLSIILQFCILKCIGIDEKIAKNDLSNLSTTI